jgi:hypothetical protein
VVAGGAGARAPTLLSGLSILDGGGGGALRGAALAATAAAAALNIKAGKRSAFKRQR